MGITPYAAETRGYHAVRDYVAINHRGRPIAGPFNDYSEAKQAADHAHGYVQFAAAGSFCT
ncbi:MAG: hypothetical protein ACRDOK_20470 [Streptosporangiaceae bacterium]